MPLLSPRGRRLCTPSPALTGGAFFAHTALSDSASELRQSCLPNDNAEMRFCQMTRYYFNVYSWRYGETIDVAGVDLPDMEAAHEKAIFSLRSFFMDEIKEGRIDLCGWVEIIEPVGKNYLTLPFKAAIEIIRPCRRSPG